MQYARGKHCVIFCVSVKHAEFIAQELINRGIVSKAVSGSMSSCDRKEILTAYEEGKIEVLCACDLLNEGWDSPKTNVLFMARPTMSKVLYTQQLGRGMRLSEDKNCLMVFDFVDNANIFSTAYSLHRMFGQKQYREGGLVLANQHNKDIDEELYRKGERPEALIDYPISAMDYEIIDIFNWQTEAEGMVSQMEFVRRVDVHSETIERYIREGKIIADLTVPTSSERVFRYFKEEAIENYAKKFGWKFIDDSTKKDLFMDMVRQMDMSYSYKPVLLMAIFKFIDAKGRVALSDIVRYFADFYSERKQAGLIVEKSNSLYCNESCTNKEIERNILINPYRRFEEMNMLHHTKTLGIIELDSHIFKKLTTEDKTEILQICNQKLDEYYRRF
jgi:type I site-specific restriction endonuclease